MTPPLLLTIGLMVMVAELPLAAVVTAVITAVLVLSLALVVVSGILLAPFHCAEAILEHISGNDKSNIRIVHRCPIPSDLLITEGPPWDFYCAAKFVAHIT